MAYKKYIRRGGKVFGPYYYESYRENGIVKKRYVKAADLGEELSPQNDLSNRRKPAGIFKKEFLLFIFAVIIVLSAVSIFYMIINKDVGLTGFTGTDIRVVYEKGENLAGTINFNLKEGELIPANSKVLVQFGDYSVERALSELVDEQIISGTYYAEGFELKGGGEGYGVAGKSDNPIVDFELEVLKMDNSESGSSASPESSNADVGANEQTAPTGDEQSAGSEQQTTLNEQQTEIQPQTGENDGQQVSAEQQASEPQAEGNAEQSASSEPSGASSEGSSSGESSSGDSGNSGGSILTGNVINEGNSDSVIQGSVKNGEDYVHNLNDGESVRIVPGSVKIDGQAVGDDKITLETSDGKVIVKTDYSSVEGFGEDHLGENALTLKIDISRLNIPAERSGELSLELIFEDIVIASSQAEVSVNGGKEQNESLSNLTLIEGEAGTNLTLLKEIPTVRIARDGHSVINMSEYFANAEGYSVDILNVDAEFNGGLITLRPKEGTKGAMNGKITAYSGNNQLESNPFVVLVSSGAVKVETNHDKIKINEKVKWTKNVSLEIPEKIDIELPKEAENVSVRKIENGDEVDAKSSVTGNAILEYKSNNGLITRLMNFFKGGGLTGRVISEETTENSSVSVSLKDNATEYVVEYYTEAPKATEKETPRGKEVIISAPDELGYTDVLSFANIQEVFKVGEESKIEIYWAETDSYIPFDAYDMDSDGKIDYVEWITPHLSNQTFEIILLIQAAHLDKNKNFISDIYDSVREYDGAWSEPVNAGEYIRTRFERNLTTKNDITLYAKSNKKGTRVVVYNVNSNIAIAEFPEIYGKNYYKIYLNGTNVNSDLFDLKVVNVNSKAYLTLDHIIDPKLSARNGTFFEDFESGTLLMNNWTDEGAGKPWIIFSKPNSDLYAGTYSLKADDTDGESVIELSIDTSNYTQMLFSFYARTVGLDAGEYFAADWFDGIAWNSMMRAQDLNGYAPLAFNLTKFVLASSANNNPNLRIRFRCSSDSPSERCLLDNVGFGTGFVVYNLPNNMKAFLADNNSVDVTKVPQTGKKWVYIAKGNMKNIVSKLNLDFSTSIDFSDINMTINKTLKKSVMHKSSYQETIGTRDLLIPSSGAGAVYVCPKAETLEEVRDNCPQKVLIRLGETVGGMTLSETMVDGEKYYLVSNVTGTGGAEVDLIAPAVSIAYPLNITYSAAITTLNYTASDNTALDSCWYSTNSGVTNASITCGANIAGLTSAEGSNSWRVYANDTSGNVNSSSVTFFKDTIAPFIAIRSPANSVYDSASILVNISHSGAQSVWFRNSTGQNESYTVPVYSVWNEGANILRAYATDAAGNVNSTNITFNVDTIAPTVNIASPFEITYNTNLVLVNLTSADATSLWFTNSSGVNESYSTPVYRAWAEGENTIKAYANNSAGITSSIIALFGVDTTSPSIIINGPLSGEYNYSAILVNFSADSYQSLWYNNGNVNISYSSPVYINLSDGDYEFIFYANDSVGNLNYGSVAFSINTSLPQSEVSSEPVLISGRGVYAEEEKKNESGREDVKLTKQKKTGSESASGNSDNINSGGEEAGGAIANGVQDSNKADNSSGQKVASVGISMLPLVLSVALSFMFLTYWRVTKKKTIRRGSIYVLLIAGVVLSLALFAYRGAIFEGGSINAQVSLDMPTSYAVGEHLSGNLRFSIKQGELVPVDSKVIAALGEQRVEMPLSELVSESTNEGNYYAENTEISGTGMGYGAEGTRVVYPNVDFELEVSSTNSGNSNSGEASGQQTPVESEGNTGQPAEGNTGQQAEGNTGQQAESEQQPVESSSEQTAPNEQQTGNEPVAPVEPQAEGNAGQSASSEPSGASSEGSSSGESSSGDSENSGGSTITGMAINGGDSIITGNVGKENEFVYNLNSGESVRIVPGSVKIDGQAVGDDKISLEVSDGKVIVKTDYSVESRGYGREYLGEIAMGLDVDISKFNISAESGSFAIELSYNGQPLVSAQKNIVVSTEAEDNNITKPEIQNETEINDTIVINTTNARASIKTSHARIKLGEKVRWTKNITLDAPDKINVEIPREAENISVVKIEENGEINEGSAQITGRVISGEVISGEAISGQVSADIELEREPRIVRFFKKLFKSIFGTGIGITGNVISIDENNTSDGITVSIEDNATNYAIEYYTDAPISIEEEMEDGKKVIISAPDELNYTDVLSYTNISETLGVGQESEIQVYWVEDNSYVPFDAYDLNENGLIDYVEWITPHLSNQTFEIIMTTTLCDAEDNEPNKGTFSSLCNGAYNLSSVCGQNGDLLSCNDNYSETHTLSRNKYAGVRVRGSINNTGVCLEIKQVFVCYEWWSSATGATDCSIKVKADANQSFADVTTACPGAAANPGTTCVNVTGMQNWSCDSFFGGTKPDAKLKSEISTSSQESASATWDILAFNVTYVETEIAINETVRDSFGNELNTTLEVIDSSNNIIYNQTGKNHYKKVLRGNYNLVIKPQNHKIKQIQFNNINISQNITSLVDIEDPSNNQGYDELYSINPKVNITGTNTTIDVTIDSAEANTLYKCRDWNFTTQSCYGSWQKYYFMIPGNSYTFTISGEDPGFVETGESTNYLLNTADSQFSTYKQMRNQTAGGTAYSSEINIGSSFTGIKCWSENWTSRNWTSVTSVNGTWNFSIFGYCSNTPPVAYLFANIFKLNATGRYDLANTTNSSTNLCAASSSTVNNWAYNLPAGALTNLSIGERIGVQFCVNVTTGRTGVRTAGIAWENGTASNIQIPLKWWDIGVPQIAYGARTETSGTMRANIIVNVTATDDISLRNVTINLYNSTGLVNSTTTTTSPNFVNFTSLTDGIYYFNATAWDYDTNFNFTETRNVTVHATPPNCTMRSPANHSLDVDGFVRFNCLASDDLGLSNVTLYINGAANASRDVTGYNTTAEFNVSLADGSYNWSCGAYDLAGNYRGAAPKIILVNTSAAPAYNISYFSGNTTNWTAVEDITNVSGAVLDSSSAMVSWHGGVNAEGANFDSNVVLSYNNITLLSEGLNPTFNSSATITMRNLNYSRTPIILKDGVRCSVSECPNVVYDSASGAVIFNVTHFSSYTTILAKDGFHLDENRSIIENVYEQIKANDDVYASIPSGDYLRVIFKQNLTSGNDITIYARSNYSNASIEVYEQNQSVLLGKFENIPTDKSQLKMYLTNLTGSQDTFDLRVNGTNVEFDYITDPTFTLTNCNQLYTQVNGTNDYVLGNDIDCAYNATGGIAGFTGNFDCRGYKIKRLNVTTITYNIGLFKTYSTGTIRNCGFENAYMSQNYGYDGIVVGKMTSGSILDSWINGSYYITGSQHAAAFVGQFDGGLINRSWAIVPIDCTGTTCFYAGGLVSSTSAGTIQNSFALTNYTGANWNTASIYALVDGSLTSAINNWYDNVTVTRAGTPIGANSGTPAGTFNMTSNNLSWYKGTVSNHAPFDKWDFVNTWMNVAGDYPRLQVQAAPTVAITYPVNGSTYNNITSLDLNYTVTGGVNCKYSANGGVTNVTITCGTNTSLYPRAGRQTWTVYSTSGGVENRSTTTFNVNNLGIANCSQLQNMSLNVTASYYLANDINCSETRNWSAGVGFVPIDSFSGTLDGMGYKVSEILINPGAAFNVGGAVFQATLGSALIKNVGFEDINVSGVASSRQYWGAVVGTNGGTINNTYALRGIVSGTNIIGGFVGLNNGNISNSYCTASVTVGSGNFAGGFVGDTGTGSKISSCFAAGNVTAGFAAGGFAGQSTAGVNVFFNDKWDNVTSGRTSCLGLGTNPADVNCSGAGVVYFKGDVSTRAPMSNWSYPPWYQWTSPADYPRLQAQNVTGVIVNITYPQNTTYNVNVSALNYTVSGDFQTCWYSLNLGAANVTITCGTNATGLASNEGSNTWRVYANDSTGNTNFSSVTFFKDTVNPAINFTNPTEASGSLISRNSILVNVTASDSGSGLKNITINLYNSTRNLVNSTNGTNSPLFVNYTNLANGIYYFNATAYDSAGNRNDTETRNATIDTSGPNFVFNYQNPADIGSLNAYSSGVNVSYNITNSFAGINASGVTLYYKTNSTTSDITHYINGSSHTGFFNETGTNSSAVWTFRLHDDDVYPGDFNLNPDFVENTPHSIFTLSSNGDSAKMQFLNVSNKTQYNVFEFMANSTAAASSVFVFYCNSTYTSGSILTNTNCVQFSSLSGTQTFNITDSNLNNSRYQIASMTINTTSGTVGTIKVTSVSYFILRRGGGSGSWSVYNIATTSRAGAAQTSTNSGGVWTNQTFTLDYNLHQYSGNDTFRYYACASDNLGNSNCSDQRTDLIDLGGVPPSTPHVFAPTTGFYSGNISINYTAAVSPNDFPILFYNISLNNVDESFNKTIITNNSVNLSYIWNSLGTPDGAYLVKVVAKDNQSLTSFDFSENFTIDNTPPLAQFANPTETSGSVYIRNNIAINATASDSGSGLTNITINLYNSTRNLINSTNSTTSPLFVNYTDLTDGIYYFNATAYDSAGNRNNTETRNVTIDTTAPTISIISPADLIYNNRTLLVNISSNGDYIWFTNASGQNESYTVPVYRVWNESANTMFAYVNDSAGNANQASVNFFIDTTNPTINFTNPTEANGSIITRNNLIVNVTAADSGSGLKNITIFLYNSTRDLISSNNSLVSPNFINYTDLTDGIYYFNATAYDNAGNRNLTETRTVTIDTTNPTINFTNPTELNGSFLNRNNILVNVTATDATLANITINLYNSTGLVNSTVSTTSPNFINFTNLANGIYYFNATAYDSAGNTNSTGTRNVTIDTTNPTINFTSPTEDSSLFISRSNIIVNVTAADSGSGLKNITIFLYNSTGLVNSTNGTNSPLFVNYTNLANGIYYFNATAYDNAGNRNNTETRNVTIDNINPAINLTYPQNITYNINVSELNYTVSDANLQACWYSLNLGAANVTITCGTNATGLASNEGSNSWRVYANDSAGNTNFSSVTFFKDTVNPAINFTNPTEASGSLISRNSILVNVTASDSGSGLRNVTINLYNSTGLVNSTTTTTSPNFVNFTNLANGIYYFNATAYDNAGNRNNTETRNVTIDTIAPFIAIIAPQNTTYNNRTQLVNISTTGASYVLFTNSSGDNETYLGEVYRLFNEGTNVLFAYANDTAGNLNQTNVTFFVDSINPGIEFVLPTETSGSVISRNNTLINVTAADSGSGLKNITIFLYNSTGLVNSTNGTNSPLFVNYTNLANGIYYFNATAYDNAGNRNNTETRNVTINTNIPSVTIIHPQNTTYNNRTQLVNISTTGASSIWYNWNGTNITYTIPANVLFNEGTNTLAAYANNSAGIVGSSEVTFFIDTAAPFIAIIAPQNTTYNNRTQLVNISTTGANYVWFTNASGQNVTYTTAINVLFNEGTNVLFAYANDTAGNLNQTNVTFSVDSVKPAVQFVNPTIANGSILSQGSIHANVSASDVNFDAIQVFLYNSTGLVRVNSSNSPVFFVNFTGLDDGTYYLNATANDSVGNTNNTETRQISLDRVNPIISFVSPTESSGSLLNRRNIEITVTAANTHLANITINLYNSTGLVNSTTTTTSPNFVNYTNLADGIYYFNATAYDFAGNLNRTETRTATIDTLAPSVTGLIPAAGSSFNPLTIIEVSANVSDINGVSSVSANITLPNGNLTSITLTNATGNKYNSSFAITAEGIHNITIIASDNSGNLNNSERTYFTANDTLAPVISLLNPGNGVSYSSTNQKVFFQYNVSEFNISNCSLTVNNAIVNFSSSVTTSGINEFINSFGAGSYLWNVSCIDANGNAGISGTRTFSVTAPAAPAAAPAAGGGGGGGGGGGAPIRREVPIPPQKKTEIIVVDPSALSISVIVDEKTTRELSLTNLENKSIKVSIEVTGEIKDVLKIDEKLINLAENEKRVLKVRVENAKKGILVGKIIFRFEGYSLEVPVTIDVKSKNFLFDASLSIADGFRFIYAGESLLTQVNLLQVGVSEKVDVVANYIIKDLSGKKYVEESETFFVLNAKDYVKEFPTQNLPAGKYVVGLELVYPGAFATSSSQFEVVEKGIKSPFVQIWVVVAAAAAVALIFISWALWRVVRMRRILSKRKKR